MREDGREAAGDLLAWAQAQKKEIGPDQYSDLVMKFPKLSDYDFTQVDDAVYEALKRIIKPEVNRTMGKVAGEGRGLEYWRRLYREHEGDSV